MSKSTFVPAGTKMKRCDRDSRYSSTAFATASTQSSCAEPFNSSNSNPLSVCIENATGLMSNRSR